MESNQGYINSTSYMILNTFKIDIKWYAIKCWINSLENIKQTIYKYTIWASNPIQPPHGTAKTNKRNENLGQHHHFITQSIVYHPKNRPGPKFIRCIWYTAKRCARFSELHTWCNTSATGAVVQRRLSFRLPAQPLENIPLSPNSELVSCASFFAYSLLLFEKRPS